MKQKIKVWDAPTRIFHWSLVLLIPFMWWSADTGGSWLAWHLRGGLLILGLLVFRLLWGFFGSDTARFHRFVQGPQQIKRYLNGQLTENEQPGHNPLGALMVLALLAGLGIQVGSGLFAADENSFTYSGYLNAWAGEAGGSVARNVHVTFFWVLLGLIAVHVLVIVLYKLVKKHDLIRPMLTGFKHIEGQVPVLRFTSWRIAVLLLIGVAALLAVVANIAS